MKALRKKELFSSPEGRVLMIGIILALLYLVLLLLTFIFSPEHSQLLIAMTAINIVFGRAAALSFGYTVGLSHGIVIVMNIIIETILVFLFYPLFLLSYQRLIVVKALNNMIKTVRDAAEDKQDLIRKYSILGLFLFVWFPFWMTGPVVGCAIGYVLGLQIWLNFTIILSGTSLAIVCWAFFLSRFHNWVAAYNPYAPAVLLVTVLVIIVGCRLLYNKTNTNGFKRQKGS